jgi:hypothetical protein
VYKFFIVNPNGKKYIDGVVILKWNAVILTGGVGDGFKLLCSWRWNFFVYNRSM